MEVDEIEVDKMGSRRRGDIINRRIPNDDYRNAWHEHVLYITVLFNMLTQQCNL